MSSKPFTRASAAIREAIHAQWRDWTRYLEARLALLDVRIAERRIAFERDNNLEERADQARTVLAVIPQARRLLFDQLCEERRQVLQAGLESTLKERHDPDDVEREVLQALLSEAQGRHDPDGWGVVPIQEGANLTWYEVHVASLQAAPDAATYALRADDTQRMRSRYMLAGFLAVGGVLFLLIWFLWPGTAVEPSVGAPHAAMVNGQPINPWPVVGVIIEHPGLSPLTLPVLPRDSVPLVQADDQPRAFWTPQQMMPLQLCLPDELFAQAHALTLLSGEGMPDRRYRLDSVETTRPDLRIDSCAGDGASRPATLSQSLPAVDAPIGTTQSLDGDHAATLVALRIVGPDEEPDLPQGLARVTLQLRATISDWVPYAPTLLLSSGQARLPAESPITTNGVTNIRYLIPVPVRALPIVWSLTSPDSGRVVRWRTILAAPLERSALLQKVLTVVVVSPLLQDNALSLKVTLHNNHDQSLQLTSGDLQLSGEVSNKLISLTASELGEPLAPGDTQTIILRTELQAAPTEPLLLTIGTARFRLTLPRAGGVGGVGHPQISQPPPGEEGFALHEISQPHRG